MALSEKPVGNSFKPFPFFRLSEAPSLSASFVYKLGGVGPFSVTIRDKISPKRKPVPPSLSPGISFVGKTEGAS